MISGVKQSLLANRKRLAVAGVLAVLFVLAAFNIDRLFDSVPTVEEAPNELPGTHVERTEIANTPTGDTIRDILLDQEYQQTLPKKPEVKKRNREVAAPMPEWAVSLIRFILVALAIGTVVAFIWILVVGMQGGTPSQPVKKNIKRTRKVAPVEHHMLVPSATLADVEAMVEKGEYGEAVRLLLSIVLTKLSAQDLIRIAPSMTGREIVSSASLTSGPLEGLRQLVRTVETYAFAGHAVDKVDFEACLKSFETLNALKGSAR